MNLGAGQAHGTFLIFLHADSQLPEGYIAQTPYILRLSFCARQWIRALTSSPALHVMANLPLRTQAQSGACSCRFKAAMEQAMQAQERSTGRTAHWGCFQSIRLDVRPYACQLQITLPISKISSGYASHSGASSRAVRGQLRYPARLPLYRHLSILQTGGGRS